MARVFVAMEMGEVVREGYYAWVKGKENWPVRFMESNTLHATLLPPRETEDVESLVADFSMFDFSSDFSYSFRSIELGTDPLRPRLVWALGDMPREFLLLRSSLAKLLKRPLEERDSLFHTTLMRFREEDISFVPRDRFPEPIEWKDVARKIVLYESHLQSTGSIFRELASKSISDERYSKTIQL